MYKWLGVIFLAFFLGKDIYAQENGLTTEKKCFSVKFQWIGNLMIIPVEINENEQFNFIVDTGSRYTIISDLDLIEELNINRGNLISIGGLGHGKEYTAYDSKGNRLKLGKAVNRNAQVIILMDSPLDLSAKMGIPVHGIIGFEAFKNFVVEINYHTNRMIFYRHDYFNRKRNRKLRKFQKIPLEFHQGKPYLRTHVEITNNTPIPAKLLLDTGGWDAVWLFKDSNPNFTVPAKNFIDTLGFGLNGAITGERSKIRNLKISNHTFKRPTTSFPDSLSIANVVKFEERNGSIGGEIISRFHVVFDYRNRELWVKKNRNFSKPFHYNMSGLSIVKPYLTIPLYEVQSVVKNSPAYKSGLRKGDYIHSINGFGPTKLSLAEVYEIFHKKPGKTIRIVYERNGIKNKARFVLEDIL